MLTKRKLIEVLQYDALTGEWHWLVAQGSQVAGAPAGNRHADGYRYIKIDRKLYRSTRLIWLYLYGKWPQFHIDHINRNTSDDRLRNLREASRSQNLHNSKLSVKNTTGFKGVFRNENNRFRACISNDGHRIHLGYFATAKKAHAAYAAKAYELFGEFARVE